MTNNALITIASICDVHLLYEAVHIANNYQSGPLSFAVFLDGNYQEVDLEVTLQSPSPSLSLSLPMSLLTVCMFPQDIYSILGSHFFNVSNAYDITIGVLAVNNASDFYQSMYAARSFTVCPLSRSACGGVVCGVVSE